MAEIANGTASISGNNASIFQINIFQFNRMPAKPTCQLYRLHFNMSGSGVTPLPDRSC